MPENFAFHREKVTLLRPSSRQTSSTVTPASASCDASIIICSSEYFFAVVRPPMTA
jgi:hypothetical protein